MKNYSAIITLKNLFILFVFLFTSCENSKFSPFDVDVDVPYIQNLKISNHIIDTDTIRYNNQFSIEDTIIINNQMIVNVRNNGSDQIKSVIFSVTRETDNTIIENGLLTYRRTFIENGISYNEYTGSTNFLIQRKVVGIFTVRVVAIDKDGNNSNVLFASFEIIRSGKPPVIYDLSAPDTVYLPSSGQKVILITIKATDPNNDIKEVYFRSLDSSDPNRKFFLYDNGNISVNGDSTANDGIYSILISLPYNMTPKAYRFEFEAKDYTELLSNKILHTLNVIK